MPYKLNEARRHKIPQGRYRVTNWPDDDAALVRRGDHTVWMNKEAMVASRCLRIIGTRGSRSDQPLFAAMGFPNWAP
jgi:hypothetical protein